MFATLSATEVAFALIAVMQAVLALVWLIGGGGPARCAVPPCNGPPTRA